MRLIISNKIGKFFKKRGVKIKIAVPILDKSDGRISFKKVVYIRKAKHSSRVIINRGTEENPYFNIYPGAFFKKGVAKK